MKLTAAIVGMATLGLVMATASLVQAQHEQMKGPMMMGRYDQKTEVTIQGTVEKIERPGSENMPRMGIRLVVKSGNETFKVHLGPAAFVERTMTFKEGDTVGLTASKITMMGETVLMAREVKKGDTVLKLRDENGVPLWRGMHGRLS